MNECGYFYKYAIFKFIYIVNIFIFFQRDVEPLDAQQKQWILLAARADYNALSKMCHDNAKIVKTKVFVYFFALSFVCFF